MQASRSQEGYVIPIGKPYLFRSERKLEVHLKQKLTDSCTSLSVATSTTTAKVGGSCSLSLSVATRNSAEPGNTMAALGDRRGPSSLVMLGYAHEKWVRREKAIKALVRRDILFDVKPQRNNQDETMQRPCRVIVDIRLGQRSDVGARSLPVASQKASYIPRGNPFTVGCNKFELPLHFYSRF